MTPRTDKIQCPDLPEHHEPYDPVNFRPEEWAMIFNALRDHADRLEWRALHHPANKQLPPAVMRYRELARRAVMARIFARDYCEEVPSDGAQDK